MTSESPAILGEDLIRTAAVAAPVTASSRTDDIPASWDERTVLATMLDYVRDTVHAKCAGLTDEQARRAPLPARPGASKDTQLTISGPKAALVGAILQPAAATQLAQAGKIQLDGDQAALATYAGLLDEFDLNFNIITP